VYIVNFVYSPDSDKLVSGRSPIPGRVYLCYEVGSFPVNLIPPHIRWDEKKEPMYTRHEECVMMRRQVKKSKVLLLLVVLVLVLFQFITSFLMLIFVDSLCYII